MKYVALFRGVNVGGKNRVEMKKLRTLLESIRYINVQTYLNSGNAIFESNDNKLVVHDLVSTEFKKTFGFQVSILIKTIEEIIEIANALPVEWMNNSEYKSDVAYLFSEIDNDDVIDLLPINKKYIDIRYIQGAIIWSINKNNYNKSKLNKIASHVIYKDMTIRNVNTARALAEK